MRKVLIQYFVSIDHNVTADSYCQAGTFATGYVSSKMQAICRNVVADGAAC